MSTSLCCGLLLILLLAMLSTTSMEDRSLVTPLRSLRPMRLSAMRQCLKQREKPTHWMLREESPITSPWWLCQGNYPVLLLNFLPSKVGDSYILPSFISLSLAVSAEPTKLTIEVCDYCYNNTHVNITVSWEQMPATEYVIYYQFEGEEPTNTTQLENNTKNHTFNDLERGVPYDIILEARSVNVTYVVSDIFFGIYEHYFCFLYGNVQLSSYSSRRAR